MLVIDVRNVNGAWNDCKLHINSTHAIEKDSRVGRVREYRDPVTTKYRFPNERVLFDVARDANPFFHFFESLWMLAGRNDIAWIALFNQRMKSFSDDGKVQSGAYGYRWRNAFHFDQLDAVIGMLKANHNERRAVLQMWNPATDLGSTGVDVPCNTAVYFKIREGYLYMTVSNRSNDVVWGAYGANAVHMSYLQEYVAAKVGVQMGAYHQVSDSWHAYTEVWEKVGGKTLNFGPPYDLYEELLVEPYPLMNAPGCFDAELDRWMDNPLALYDNYSNRIFDEVATNMYVAWQAYKDDDETKALGYADHIAASDWALGCSRWLKRKFAARRNRQLKEAA